MVLAVDKLKTKPNKKRDINLPRNVSSVLPKGLLPAPAVGEWNLIPESPCPWLSWGGHRREEILVFHEIFKWI